MVSRARWLPKLSGFSVAVVDIQRGKARRSVQAVPQVNRQSGIARPQRIAHPALAFGLGFGLADAVHCKSPGAGQPFSVARSLVEPEKGVPVTARAVAQVGAFDQGS